MRTILFANGCSMTYGLELADNPDGTCRDDVYRLENSWPGQLKKILNFKEVHNIAVNSGSNDRVLRTTIHWVLEKINEVKNLTDMLLVVIGWSHAMRREFYIDNEWFQVVPYHDHKNQKLNRLNMVYREVAWNETESALRFFTEILSLQSFLKIHKIPYLFFDSISPIQEQIINGKTEALPYVRHIDIRRYYGFNNINSCMADVIRENVPEWNGKHPSGAGHAYWAKLLAAYIENNNLLDPLAEPQTQETIMQPVKRKYKDKRFIYP